MVKETYQPCRNSFHIIKLVVSDACNLSYSGGRDQDDQGLSQPVQIVHPLKMTGGVAHCVGPEFMPQYCQQRSKQKRLQKKSQ
jgi:hypothetical protein